MPNEDLYFAGRQAWTLLELMVNMDLALLGELNADDGLRDLAAEPWSSPAERLGDVTSRESTYTSSILLCGF